MQGIWVQTLVRKVRIIRTHLRGRGCLFCLPFFFFKDSLMQIIFEVFFEFVIYPKCIASALCLGSLAARHVRSSSQSRDVTHTSHIGR